jgi:hypothetical protein
MAGRPIRFVGVAVLAAASMAAGAGECRLDSASHRVTVVELYTSEGCSSCPPADRWLSGLARQGITPDSAVLLAWHVDYWNQLGWPDRFSQQAFSERQRQAAVHAGAGFVYTPQVVVDGRDFRPVATERLRQRLASINREEAGVRIEAGIRVEGRALAVQGTVAASRPVPIARTWIAVFENGLSTEVRAGENAGARLIHDYVVRRLGGPFAPDPLGRTVIDWRIDLPDEWNPERTGVAVFVEDATTGSVLGATARSPLCRS